MFTEILSKQTTAEFKAFFKDYEFAFDSPEATQKLLMQTLSDAVSNPNSEKEKLEIANMIDTTQCFLQGWNLLCKMRNEIK